MGKIRHTNDVRMNHVVVFRMQRYDDFLEWQGILENLLVI